MNEVSRKLDIILEEYNLTIQQVADKLGITYGYLRNQKSKKTNSPKLLEKMNEVFSVNDGKPFTNIPLFDELRGSMYYYQALVKEKEARHREMEDRAIRAEASATRLLTVIENLTLVISDFRKAIAK